MHKERERIEQQNQNYKCNSAEKQLTGAEQKKKTKINITANIIRSIEQEFAYLTVILCNLQIHIKIEQRKKSKNLRNKRCICK